MPDRKPSAVGNARAAIATACFKTDPRSGGADDPLQAMLIINAGYELVEGMKQAGDDEKARGRAADAFGYAVHAALRPVAEPAREALEEIVAVAENGGTLNAVAKLARIGLQTTADEPRPWGWDEAERRGLVAAAQTPDTARLGTPSTPPAAHATASEGTTSDAAAPIEAVLAELVAANENMEATERMVRKKYAPPSDMAYGQTHSFTIQFPDPDMTAAGQRLFLAWRDARLANGGTVTADDPDTEPGGLGER